MSWADIQRAIFGDTTNLEQFRHKSRQALGIPQRNWSSDEIGMPKIGAAAPISGLNTAPNLGIPVARAPRCADWHAAVCSLEPRTHRPAATCAAVP
ncbi:hypothetical protein JNW90_13695 [Micromonospora sp. STR1s_5]|nr:hypothetical protein [Micromonospora sp. STR1s_5]